MTTWLNKQRKQTILELSSEAGLKQDEDTRKDELVENLDKYLKQNATRLSSNTSFEPYYGTRRTPFKARSTSATGVTSDDGEVKSVVKARGRRTTKVKSETDDDDGEASSPGHALIPTSSALATRTPGRPRRRSELPPSPADVADDVEYAATRMYEGINDLYSVSGISERIDRVRELCSSVTGVQMSFLFLEALGIQRLLLPWEYTFDVPSQRFLGLSTPAIPFFLPDLFRLVGGQFWKVSLLWAATSIAIPAFFAYFYNLSTRVVKRHGAPVTVARYRFDPLIFNIAKAIVTWVVYVNGYTFGLVDTLTIQSVNVAIFGGYRGILVGSYVPMIAAIYEAAQRK